MKKKDILVGGVISWLIGLPGVVYMQINSLIYLYLVILPAVFFIYWIYTKYFSEPEKERVIEMLREFISLLISDLEGKIEEIDRVLSGDKQFALTLIRPSYKYAHTDILGDENYKWIKEKVDEYNNLVRGERLEEAKEIANELKGGLEELKKKHAKENSIAEKEIEKKKYTPYVIKERKRT
ncbi:MAG: hypothetical protein N2V78_06050 [Methanophagales archaeon]|nr:hypothetical protein [Methanophagales archaeon]